MKLKVDSSVWRQPHSQEEKIIIRSPGLQLTPSLIRNMLGKIGFHPCPGPFHKPKEVPGHLLPLSDVRAQVNAAEREPENHPAVHAVQIIDQGFHGLVDLFFSASLTNVSISLSKAKDWPPCMSFCELCGIIAAKAAAEAGLWPADIPCPLLKPFFQEFPRGICIQAKSFP